MARRENSPHRGTEVASEPVRRRRVLVAEDTAPLRRMLVKALTLHGCEVCAVEDAQEVAAAVTSFAPDIVLLDWNLGSCSSAATLRRLREERVPVIVMTGDPQAVDVTDVLVLAKPIDLERLRREIGEVERRS